MTLFKTLKESPMIPPANSVNYEFYLDLETTDTAHTAGIWEIGCYVINHKEQVVASFERLCYPTGSVSSDTMDWIKSKPDVYDRYLGARNSGISQENAIQELFAFIKRVGIEGNRETETGYSWGTFDFPILTNAATKANLDLPWHYGSECDLRSVAKFYNTLIRPDTSKHEALADAKALRLAHRDFITLFGSPLQ